MPIDPTPITPAETPGREQTDESLRAEREKADVALDHQQVIDRGADLVMLRAREVADAVLVVAREKADQRLEEVSTVAAPGKAERVLDQERLREDEKLRVERTAADVRLRHEREEHVRALARLLPMERDKTDRFLFAERERADDAVAKRDDFLGMVSHDLRDLLGGIVLSSAVLTKCGVGRHEDGVLEAAARIQRYAARMNRLIGDLLDVASIDAGKLEMVTAPGDGATLLAEAVDVFQATASAKGITLAVEPATGPLLAEFDHDRLLQVLANLITNAIKFTPNGGRVTLRGDQGRGEMRVSVTDTGCGIPVSQLTDVFERFWQVGVNDRRGLGLGLHISKCIVEAHRGRIWAESEPGNGSRFLFTVPAGK